jgi:O-antigen biosynthesis protein
MSAADPALAARVEAWIDTAGHTGEEVRATTRAALDAGFDPSGVFVVLDDEAREDTSATIDGLRELGVGVLDADAMTLNARLDSSSAEFLFVVRWGGVVRELLPHAVGFLDRFPDIDLVYGDSVTQVGHAFYRPLFSPIRLRSNDYLGPVVAARREVIQQLGGFRDEAKRAQVLDLVLRADLNRRSVALVPEVLATEVLTREDFAGTSDAQRRVVEAHLAREGVEASVEEVEPFLRRLRYRIHDEPLISIVIPTRGGSAEISGRRRVLIVEALRGIIERSTYRNFEIVVVADAETPSEVIAELVELCGDRLRLVLWDAPFNFSAKMNRGAVAARGDYLLLLNDDVEVVTDDWMETLLGLAQQRGVGIVGAQLYFEDSTVQHGGQIYTGGVAGHAAFGWPGGRDDSIKSMTTDHEVSGVTAACALISRKLYFEIGGFTLALPGNYNDVDLNLKVRSTGRSAIFSPWVRLYHFESKSRDPRILESDLSTLQQRWSRRMQVELYSRML